MPKRWLRQHSIFMAVGALAGGVFPYAVFAAGDRALGEYLSSECVTCHKTAGKSEGIPTIAGLPEARLIELLNVYRIKKKSNDVMQNITARLSDQDIAALAAYFSSLKAQPGTK